MAKIERTCIDKVRTFPEWLKDAIAEERAGLQAIADPVQRRLAELEIDGIETRVRIDLSEGC